MGNSSFYDMHKVKYAGFWMRFLAKVTDNLIFGVVLILFVLLFADLSKINLQFLGTFQSFTLGVVFFFFFFAVGINVGMILSNLYLLFLIVAAIVGTQTMHIPGEQVMLILFTLFFQFGYLLYNVLMDAYKGQTLGKMLVGIKTVKADDAKLKDLDFSDSISRFFTSEVYKFIPFAFGHVWSGWDIKKQTWHDKVCKTVVVYENSLTETAEIFESDDVVESPQRTVRPILMSGKEFGQIVFVKGLNTNKNIKLKGNKVLIGRKKDEVHILVRDPEKFVSRIQCEIYFSGGRYKIKNRAPRNTTKLNGRVLSEDLPIRSGDMISFGSHSAKILLF